MVDSSVVFVIIIIAGHGSTQTDMALEKELRVLHIDLQTTGSELNVTPSET